MSLKYLPQSQHYQLRRVDSHTRKYISICLCGLFNDSLSRIDTGREGLDFHSSPRDHKQLYVHHTHILWHSCDPLRHRARRWPRTDRPCSSIITLISRLRCSAARVMSVGGKRGEYLGLGKSAPCGKTSKACNNASPATHSLLRLLSVTRSILCFRLSCLALIYSASVLPCTPSSLWSQLAIVRFYLPALRRQITRPSCAR